MKQPKLGSKAVISLRGTLLIPLLFLGLLARLMTIALVHRSFSRHLEEQAARRSEDVASSIALVHQTVSERTELKRYVTASGERHGVDLIVVVGDDPAMVIASSKPTWLGKSPSELLPEAVGASLLRAIQSRQPQHFYSPERNVHAYAAPLLSDRGGAAGAVLVQLDARPIQAEISAEAWQISVWQMALLAAITLLTYLLVSHWVLAPLHAIGLTMARRTAGDKSARAPMRADDEIGSLAQTLNSMLDAFDLAQHKLQSSEQRLRAVMSNAPTILSGIDKEGIVTVSEGKGLQLLGRAPGESVGHSFFELYHGVPELLDASRRGLAGEDVSTTVHIGGFAFETRYSPVRDESGEVVGAIGVATNVTDRVNAESKLQEAHAQLEKRVEERTAELAQLNRTLHAQIVERQMAMGALHEASEAHQQAKAEAEHAREEAEWARAEAERANEAKDEFLSRMSHELRTPLNAVLGFGQVLEMDDLSDNQRESVELILKGGYQLLELINEVLDITRVESGSLQLSREPVDVRAVVEESLDLMQPLAIEKHIWLHKSVPGAEDIYALADRQRLKQVLLNLLSNAIKYNRPGGEVRVSCRTGEPGQLRIEIHDTGRGITPEGLDKLFVPFERLDADERGVEGTGLGLMLSRRLVQAMDGALSVQSTPGVGSVFSVLLSRATGAPCHTVDE